MSAATPPLRDRFTFRSPVLGGSAEEVVRWLAGRLRSAGVPAEGEVREEAHGACLSFRAAGRPHAVRIRRREGDDFHPGDWAGRVERDAGLVASLFGGRRRGIAPEAVWAVHRALSGAPGVEALAWHTRADFAAGRGSPRPDAKGEAMGHDFGPFAPVVEPGEEAVPGYLALLRLRDDRSQDVLARIRAALEDPEIDGSIRRFLDEPNWRGHLMAAVAVLMHPRRASFADALWAAFDGGSWVSPQLAVALSFADPEFAARAQERVRRRCPVRVPAGLSPLERHSATGPAGGDARSAKNLAALLRLLEEDARLGAWARAERADPEAAALLERDVDGAGGIAAEWRRALAEHFARSGIRLEPPAG